MPKQDSLALRMYEDYLAGMGTRDLALKYYGDAGGRSLQRVRSMLSYARSRVFGLVRSIPRHPGLPPYHAELMGREVRGFLDYIRVKREYGGDPFIRQYISHGELLFYLMGRLDIRVFTNIGYTILLYHEKIWPHVWGAWRRFLRCWRNGRGKLLFSVSPHSLAYVYSLLLGVLLLYGYTGRKPRLDYAVRELLGDRYRRMYIQFLEAYRDVGAYVFSVVQHPSPPGVLEFTSTVGDV